MSKRQIGKPELVWLLRSMGVRADPQSSTTTLWDQVQAGVKNQRPCALTSPIQVWTRVDITRDDAPVCADCGETLVLVAGGAGGAVWVCNNVPRARALKALAKVHSLVLQARSELEQNGKQ